MFWRWIKNKYIKIKKRVDQRILDRRVEAYVYNWSTVSQLVHDAHRLKNEYLEVYQALIRKAEYTKEEGGSTRIGSKELPWGVEKYVIEFDVFHIGSEKSYSTEVHVYEVMSPGGPGTKSDHSCVYTGSTWVCLMDSEGGLDNISNYDVETKRKLLHACYKSINQLKEKMSAPYKETAEKDRQRLEEERRQRDAKILAERPERERQAKQAEERRQKLVEDVLNRFPKPGDE